jgi:hypothetical protein
MISEADLRLLGDVPADHELLLDSDQDAPVDDGGLIDLDTPGAERIVSRERAPKTVTIIVNARPKVVPGRDQLRGHRLGSPSTTRRAGRRSLSPVTYRKGPPQARGSLIEGATGEGSEGMVFNARFTDKS